ncbi:hypothetical protein R3P38DRAFT_1517092 [Favolaschia claudopus]|uniref:F-box domain-containing protein n=1 Tax=Favolaschia claudopus TaxID=2862362 RepID=A0AAW0AJ09_9AGAR
MSTAKSVEPLKRQHALEHTISECALLEFYPVLSLPTEIISEVFVHCLAHKPNHFGSFIPFTNLAPFVLLRVCRKWRAIATTTPRLWQNLRLDFYAMPLRFFDAENFESFLGDWVARARSLPLSLNFRGTTKSEEQGKRVLSTLFDHLAPRLERLKLDTSFAFYDQISPTFFLFCASFHRAFGMTTRTNTIAGTPQIILLKRLAPPHCFKKFACCPLMPYPNISPFPGMR